jgi:hypothetical protein
VGHVHKRIIYQTLSFIDKPGIGPAEPFVGRDSGKNIIRDFKVFKPACPQNPFVFQLTPPEK